jgi:polysaccharide deacetylase family sporulation protein PdaB
MDRKKLLNEPEQEPKLDQSLETQVSKEKVASLFVKVGIIVLSIIMIVGFGIRIIPTAVTVTNLSTKNDLPIYSVNLEEPKVSLSFDAAWTNEDTSEILEILDQYKVKATFFMTGEWVEKYPKDVKAIAAAGHDLGNHSENHKQMSDLPKNECEEEIMMAHNRVKELTGIEMKLFRAPYGDYNNKIVGTARECGYFTIQWNVDSYDWKDYGVDSILSKTVDNRKLGSGSILLFHVGTKYTAEALEKIIVGLQEKGYEIVPVSQLIYTGEYKVDQMGRQIEK